MLKLTSPSPPSIEVSRFSGGIGHPKASTSVPFAWMMEADWPLPTKCPVPSWTDSSVTWLPNPLPQMLSWPLYQEPVWRDPYVTFWKAHPFKGKHTWKVVAWAMSEPMPDMSIEEIICMPSPYWSISTMVKGVSWHDNWKNWSHHSFKCKNLVFSHPFIFWYKQRCYLCLAKRGRDNK